MTGYKSKRTAALDEEGMYLVHQTAQPEQQKPYRLLQDNGSKYFGESWDKAEQPAQEPVAWMKASDTEWSISFFEEDGYVPLYTTPPQRTWVGLTDEERRSIREWQRIQEELGAVWSPMMLYLYEAIEAKLKEKNNG